MDPLQAKAELDVQERIKILPQEIIDLVTDGTLDAVALTLQEEYGLTETQKKLLENEIILVLAMFLNPSDFAQNVAESLEIDPTIAQAIEVEVKNEIFDLVDDILASVISARREIQASLGDTTLLHTMEKKESLSKLADTFAQPKEERLENPAIQTLTENVEPLRTMEGDMNRVHGYGAYVEMKEAQANGQTGASSVQEDILAKTTPPL